jgi:hypothetical protein
MFFVTRAKPFANVRPYFVDGGGSDGCSGGGGSHLEIFKMFSPPVVRVAEKKKHWEKRVSATFSHVNCDMSLLS